MKPPCRCERHHVEHWLRDHGDTDIDNLTLLCGHHHRHFEHWGWEVVMHDGVRQMKPPCRIPPAHLDPDQRPIRNTTHHDTEITFAAV